MEPCRKCGTDTSAYSENSMRYLSRLFCRSTSSMPRTLPTKNASFLRSGRSPWSSSRGSTSFRQQIQYSSLGALLTLITHEADPPCSSMNSVDLFVNTSTTLLKSISSLLQELRYGTTKYSCQYIFRYISHEIRSCTTL